MGRGGGAAGGWSTLNLFQITPPDASPFQFHTTQFQSSGGNVSLSASLSASAARSPARQPLPARSSPSPSPSLRASLPHALPFFFNTVFLALSPPSPFNVLFKRSRLGGRSDRRTGGDREVGNGSRQWGGTEEEMNNTRDDGAASGGAGKVHSHKTILLAAPRSGDGEKR